MAYTRACYNGIVIRSSEPAITALLSGVVYNVVRSSVLQSKLSANQSSATSKLQQRLNRPKSLLPLAFHHGSQLTPLQSTSIRHIGSYLQPIKRAIMEAIMEAIMGATIEVLRIVTRCVSSRELARKLHLTSLRELVSKLHGLHRWGSLY